MSGKSPNLACRLAEGRRFRVVLVEEDLDASGLGYGLALGGLAIGALAVSLAALRSKTLSSRAMAVFALAVVVQAAGHLAMGLSPVVAVLVTTAVIAGVGNGGLRRTRAAPSRQRTRMRPTRSAIFPIT